MFGTSPRYGGIAPSTLSLPRPHLAQSSGQSLRTIVRQMNIPRTEIVRIPIRAPDYHRKSACLSLCHGRSEILFVAWLNKYIMSAQQRGHFLSRNRSLPSQPIAKWKRLDHFLVSRNKSNASDDRQPKFDTLANRKRGRVKKKIQPLARNDSPQPTDTQTPGRWIAI